MNLGAGKGEFSQTIKRGGEYLEPLKEPEFKPEPAYFTVEQLAHYLQVPTRTVGKWALSRRLPGLVKAGRLLRFQRSAIERQLLTGSVLLPKAEKRTLQPRRRRWG